MTYFMLFMPNATGRGKIMATNTISILALKGCLSSGVTGIVDTLNIANLLWMMSPESEGLPLFKTEIISVSREPVIANGGIALFPEKSIYDVEQTDLIMIPAMLLPFDLKSKNARLAIEWLKTSYAKGTILASTCTGSFLLAETGLLNGKTATTNWYFVNMFKKKYPEVNLEIDKMVTEDQGLICSGAATAFLNLCIYFIKKFGSNRLAAICSKALLIDPDKQSQAPYMFHDFWKNHLDTQILSAQNWMEDNFNNKISIDDIAEQAGISHRHFKRRFKKATNETPLAYLQHLRIEKAKQLLESSLETINEITWQVGYEDINSFRRLFKKNTGMSPKEFRNKFSGII